MGCGAGHPATLRSPVARARARRGSAGAASLLDRRNAAESAARVYGELVLPEPAVVEKWRV